MAIIQGIGQQTATSTTNVLADSLTAIAGNAIDTSAKIAFIEWVGTMNGGNTNTGAVYIDKVAASSLGRIGP